MSPEQKDSLMRVLKGIKGEARGYKKEAMKKRLGGQEPVAPEEDAVALDPANLNPGDKDPLPLQSEPEDASPELAEGESGSEDADSPEGVGMSEEEKKRAAILKLIGSV